MRTATCSPAPSALALTGAKRSALLRAELTFAEAGFPGYDVPLRWGLAEPAGTPRAIIDKLNAALNAALATEEVGAARSKAPSAADHSRGLRRHHRPRG